MIYTASTIEDFVRSELNESSQETITSDEILSVVNFGYKEIATKGLCVEKDTGIVTTANSNLIKFPSWRKVNYVELVSLDNPAIFQDTLDVLFQDTNDVIFFDTELVSDFPRRGIPCINPGSIGHTGLNNNQPQGWFQWGDFLYIDPIPSTRYLLIAYYSENPSIPVDSSLNTEPKELPEEFKRCLLYFTISMVCIKLRRWGTMIEYYNKYMELLHATKTGYISKNIDARATHVAPDNVGVRNG